MNSAKTWPDLMADLNGLAVENGRRHLEKDELIARLQSALRLRDRDLYAAHQRIQQLETELDKLHGREA